MRVREYKVLKTPTNYKASITVFLSLIMLVLIGFTSSIIEFTKVQNMKSYKRIASESAIQSTFGEYSVNLRDIYGVFALDGSYLTDSYSESNILERFEYYGGSAGDTKIETIQLLSDNDGSALKEQIINYLENQYGIDYLENIIGDFGSWEELDLGEGTSEQEISDMNSQLDDLEQGLEISEEEGTEGIFNDFKGFDIDVVYNLITKNLDVSQTTVDLSQMPSERELRKGYGDTYTRNYNEVAERAYLVEYIQRIFPSLKVGVNEDENMVVEDTSELKYQAEYCIIGKGSDKENLQGAIQRLLLLRTPINYSYLTTDTFKQGEARVLATTLSLASGGTVATEVIYQSLLWAWAYAESVVDVKSLVEGKNISLIKSADDWKFGISSLLQFGSDDVEISNQDGGLNYGEYIKMILYLQDTDTMVGRVLDMIEHTIRYKYEEKTFRVDRCVSRVNMNIIADIGMGYTYEFPIKFGYR